MADDTNNGQRPYWLPDTQGFLALGIMFVVSALAFLLLQSTIKFDDKVAGAFMTLLGVLTACLKDIISYFFPGSKDLTDNSNTIRQIAMAPSPAQPPAALPVPAWWSELSDAEKNSITTAGVEDARARAIAQAMIAGAATADDLDYLVSKGWLTQARADEIKA